MIKLNKQIIKKQKGAVKYFDFTAPFSTDFQIKGSFPCRSLKRTGRIFHRIFLRFR